MTIRGGRLICLEDRIARTDVQFASYHYSSLFHSLLHQTTETWVYAVGKSIVTPVESPLKQMLF